MVKVLKLAMISIFIFYANFLFAKEDFGRALNKKIETKNFTIIYNQNMVTIAEDLANNIEVWGNEVFQAYNAKPASRLFIFLGNYSDTVNAFSAANTIFLNFIPNTQYDFYKNWLETVFKHELSHNVIRLYNYNSLITYALGPLFDIAIPGWMHEGLSVLNETNLTNGKGRNNNEEFQSEIRYKYNENVSNYFYYNGYNPYVDGAPFFKFYEQQYGRNIHQKAMENYLGSFFSRIIFSPITIYAETANLSSEQLYQEYNNYLNKEYRIASREYFEGELLFEDKFDYDNTLISFLEVDDNNLYYYGAKKDSISGKLNTGVFSYSLSDSQHKANLYINDGVSYIYKNGKNIYYNRSSYNNYLGKEYTESYHYSYDKKFLSTTKLKGERILHTIPTKNGLLQVVGNQNKESLINQESQEVLISFASSMVFESFAYDEIKNNLFFSAGIVGSNEDVAIYQYNLDSQQLVKLVFGKQPTIENNILYYSYNQNGGRYNIYSLDLSSGDIKQLTDTRYGAFSPIYKNGILYYVGYYGKNKSIYVISKKDFMNKPNGKMLKEEVIFKNNSQFLQEDVVSMNPSENQTLKYLNEKDVSVLDYKLDSIGIGLGFFGASFSALNNTNKITVGVKNIDYRDFFKGDRGSYNSLFFDFVYSPRPFFYNIDLFSLKYYYGDTNNKLLQAEFNPILYNGFGAIPTLVINSSYNSNNDYSLGGSLLWQDKNLLLEVGHRTQYERSSNYNYYSLSFLKMAKISYWQGSNNNYALPVGDSELSNLKWRSLQTDSVINFSVSRAFDFNIYKGRKDGRLGVDKFTINPYISHFYASGDNLNKNRNSTFFVVENYINGLVNYHFKYRLGLSVHYQYDYAKGKSSDNGYYSSDGKSLGFNFLFKLLV